MEELRTSGCEVFKLKDWMPQESPDPTVISKTQELNCVLISLNGDFADIVTYPPSRFKGIIALQVHNHPEIIPSMMDRLDEYLVDHPDVDHYNGKLLLVEVQRIRIRE